ncbi:MAG: hypothetical protein C0390_11885, partial [Syntrophus sp. (in: bacteria)]|nr:hypothetical protein [Syntrophus sp. (in: bacteria)]
MLIVIALAIFYLPRVIGRRSSPVRKEVRRPALTGWMRLAILITVFWIGGSALLLNPWQGDVLPFLYTGLAPMAALWGSTWVWFGYRKY